MITLNKAKGLALEAMVRVSGRAAEELAFLDALTECKRSGWIFFYEARAYVDSGDAARALGNTGPVVVTHRGVVHTLRGGQPTKDALRDFERTLAEATTRH